MAPNYNGNPGRQSLRGRAIATAHRRQFWPPEAGGRDDNVERNAMARKINVLFCDLHAETMTFGPASTAGTFQDTTSDPLGLKHWDPTQ